MSVHERHLVWLCIFTTIVRSTQERYICYLSRSLSVTRTLIALFIFILLNMLRVFNLRVLHYRKGSQTTYAVSVQA